MMISIIGIVVVFLGGVLLARELSASRRSRLHLCEEFYRFLVHIRTQIGCFLRTPCEIAESFRGEELSKIGFLKLISQGEGFLVAFEVSKSGKYLSAEQSRILSELFSSLGGGYLQDEIKLIDGYTVEFFASLEKERKECSRDLKLISTLSCSGTLGIIILLL